MQEEIINVRNQAVAQITNAKSKEELEEIRVSYFGKNGKLSEAIKKIKIAPDSEKKHLGILINETKETINTLLANQQEKVKQTSKVWFDPTIPGIVPEIGHTHIVTQAIEEITKVFSHIGFVRVRYPEVEWDWFAFESLNMPKEHAARDEWETFFMDTQAHPHYGQMVLTPQTSSGQVREMERVKVPPIRMINIAKTHRRQSDVSHVPMFHQFEGLVVDKGISIVHLKGTLDYFAREFYGESRKTRLRPYHFPFTEPSFEVDISCGICNGTGCKVCKAGWHELGGAGMVHPVVLKNGGVDPTKYSGFAFGWGVERAYMMKPDINIGDIRTMYNTDLRYLTQF